MRKLLLLLLLVPLVLAAKPLPTGELTLVGTDPVTFTAETKFVKQRPDDHLWVSLSCFDDAGTRIYYGEENADENGLYVMDDSVWVLWTPGAVANDGTCRAFLLYQEGNFHYERVIYDTGFFEV